MNPNRRSKATLTYLKKHGLPSTFPLTPHHGSGQWRAKIKGRDYYFGALHDPEYARQLYLKELPYLESGEPVPGTEPEPAGVEESDDPAAYEIVDQWLAYQGARHRAGDIGAKTLNDYRQAAGIFKKHTPADHRVSDLRPLFWQALRLKIKEGTKSPTVISRRVTVIRMIWRWAYESEVIESSVRFGPDFKNEPAKNLRMKRHKAGKRTISSEQLRGMLDSATQPMRAMLLLGINCAMTQGEISDLNWTDVDLGKRVIDTVRSKTAVKRVATLWPETVVALKEIPRRDKAVFLTRSGLRYVRQEARDDGVYLNRDNISREFSKIAKRADVKLPKGVGFGKLRHTFRTVAGACGDVDAVRRVMGHSLGRDLVEETYTTNVSTKRIKAATDEVRRWLFDQPA